MCMCHHHDVHVPHHYNVPPLRCACATPLQCAAITMCMCHHYNVHVPPLRCAWCHHYHVHGGISIAVECVCTIRALLSSTVVCGITSSFVVATGEICGSLNEVALNLCLWKKFRNRISWLLWPMLNWSWLKYICCLCYLYIVQRMLYVARRGGCLWLVEVALSQSVTNLIRISWLMWPMLNWISAIRL